MGTAPAHFQGRLDFERLQMPLQLTQMLQRIRIIAINRDPLAALCHGVHSIQPDREPAFQVLPDNGLA